MTNASLTPPTHASSLTSAADPWMDRALVARMLAHHGVSCMASILYAHAITNKHETVHETYRLVDGDIDKVSNVLKNYLADRGGQIVLKIRHANSTCDIHTWSRGYARVASSGGTSCGLSLATFDESVLNDIVRLHPEHVAVSAEIYTFLERDHKIGIDVIGTPGESLVLDNYAPDVLDTYRRTISEFMTGVGIGRLIVFSGPPGTGKTHLIQGLIADTKVNVSILLLSSAMVARLTSPEALGTLLTFRQRHPDKPMVLVIEDADECLVNRPDGNMSAIGALLNLSDGIVGKLFDIRIICTTNARHIDLDRAVLRAGRLFRHQVIDVLSVDQARQVYKRLSGDAFDVKDAETIDTPMVLADIYQKVFDPDRRRQVAERVAGFSSAA